jgi:RNA polymerase sigma-70 factor (ECF subfamily)
VFWGDVSGVGTSDPGALVAIYRRALPQVYGYLLPRCGSVVIAEDLTAEAFMAAVASMQQGAAPEVDVPWLIGVARHKLVDHWRRQERDERSRALIGQAEQESEDRWEETLDRVDLHAALAELNGFQRAALTFRYLDGLPVAEVAEHLGRSVRATETLLVRAKAALRRAYRRSHDD